MTAICSAYHHVNKTYIYRLEHRFYTHKLICSKCSGLRRLHRARQRGLNHFTYWLHHQNRFILLHPDELNHYRNNKTRVHCMCTKCGYGKHGEWYPRINYLLNKRRVGCPLCGGTLKLTLSQAHHRVNLIFNNRISFYCMSHCGLNRGIRTKVIAHCSRCHTTWRTELVHLLRGYGCGVCSKSNGELSVINNLSHLHFHMAESKKELYGMSPLGCKHSYRVNYNNHNLSLDFMLNINHHLIAIEYDGIQHFRPTDFSHKLKMYIKEHASNKLIKHQRHIILVAWEKQIMKDYWKTQWCSKHHITLIRIKYHRRYSDMNHINPLVRTTLHKQLVPLLHRYLHPTQLSLF